MSLNRESGSDEPWGFEITGGKDVDEQLAISHVRKKLFIVGIFLVNYAMWEVSMALFLFPAQPKKGDKVTLFRANGQNKIS